MESLLTLDHLFNTFSALSNKCGYYDDLYIRAKLEDADANALEGKI